MNSLYGLGNTQETTWRECEEISFTEIKDKKILFYLYISITIISGNFHEYDCICYLDILLQRYYNAHTFFVLNDSVHVFSTLSFFSPYMLKLLKKNPLCDLLLIYGN